MGRAVLDEYVGEVLEGAVAWYTRTGPVHGSKPRTVRSPTADVDGPPAQG